MEWFYRRLADFYNSFDATDTRRGMELPELKATYGLRAGLLYGQQFNKDGVALKDRAGKSFVLYTRKSDYCFRRSS